MTDDLCRATYDMDNGDGRITALTCDQQAHRAGLLHHDPAGFWWSPCDLGHEHPEKVG